MTAGMPLWLKDELKLIARYCMALPSAIWTVIVTALVFDGDYKNHEVFGAVIAISSILALAGAVKYCLPTSWEKRR